MISDFVYITDNAYTGEEIRHMELKILSTFDFDLGRLISLNFLRRFSKAGDVDVLQHSIAKCLWSLNLQYYSRYVTSDLHELVEKMARMISTSESSMLQAVRNKYSSHKFMMVATLPHVKRA